MKPAVKLKLNGKIFDPHPPNPTVTRLKTFLDKSPVDEIFTRDELSKRSGVASNTMRAAGFIDDILKPYTAVVGKFRYWGHPKAILALREQVGQ